MSKSFSSLGVPDYICEALKRQGIQEPFEIQEKTIQEGLEGKDICGRAPTGSGKTLAFGIPLVVRTKASKPRNPQSLVLAPTRELAEQICNELRSFSGKKNVFVVYGGVGYGPQRKALSKGVDILVACPGRLEDLIEQGEVNLGAVQQVVIDEADRMADMGFMPAISRILDQTSNERQTILFSATLDREVAQLKKRYQRDPVLHEVGERTPDIKQAKHTFTVAKKSEKSVVAAEAVKVVWPAIIFCRTRHGSDRLAKQLKKLGVDAEAIHGGKSQHQRRRALENFTIGRAQTLVATDVAARGIHVDGVELVVHYDLPEDHKAYIHRSGRTARAGNEGIVLSIIQPEQRRTAKKMQERLGISEVIQRVEPERLSELSSGTSTKSRREKELDQKSGESPKLAGKATHGASSKKRNDQKSKNRSRASHHKPKGKNSPNKNRRKTNNKHVNRHASQKPKSGQNRKKSSPKSNGRPNRKARRAHLQPSNR
ncbi:MAG: DEAD/DEAH box helicase [Acidimicrobiales bacterium]|jgi:superfamily II DNA/RNA helicase|nr:DEAD/DEAH box helicase [Acidimicrobiales bacterium]MDP6297904.1 DEAD/DEAH box helicase [Acidimicrobiales bacterium]HJM28530.1 DEAD/DEAH box helicase [Acidimicrobiales bacterium]HJM97548.1 DEAD/DEAH box helicase [Acidimicrobiales bacterium]